jgi:predicted pyridoxine 5'-phosphate oxidase superfamily flavin-nucleotide-binding protein
MSTPHPSSPDATPPARTGFHAGELVVQERAGVVDAAARLARMLGTPEIGASMATFIAGRDLLFVTARDADGTLWTSALTGRPGFCTTRDGSLRIRTGSAPADVPGGLAPGTPVGILLVDFARRRRVRVNGVVSGHEHGVVTVAIDQAYGNCPRHIHRRELRAGDGGERSAPTRRHADRLAVEHVTQIRGADTVVLGTAHPAHGVDTSHRGGSPGFVRVEPDGSLWWPDLPGNDLFNSLGNIVARPEASLLFLDAPSGRLLQITGRAVLEWVPPRGPGDDGGTGRRVHLRPTRVVTTDGPPWHTVDHEVDGAGSGPA